MNKTLQAFLIAIGMIAIYGATQPQTAPPIMTPLDFSGTPPIVHNGTVGASVSTLVPGVGSPYVAYSLTNEDSTNGIRCTYGGIEGQVPSPEPSSTVGSLVAPGVTLSEKTAPNNRLDCIATAGTPAYDITMYPK